MPPLKSISAISRGTESDPSLEISVSSPTGRNMKNTPARNVVCDIVDTARQNSNRFGCRPQTLMASEYRRRAGQLP